MRLNADLKVNEDDLNEFQTIIGFKFNDQTYLIQALVHGSLFSGDKDKLNAFRKINGLENKDYEKLEYLGDSVLGLIIAEYAYHDRDINEYASSKGLTIEGVCTKIKEILASNKSLKPVAKKIKLSRFILAEPHVNIDGKLSDMIESLIGAIYLDGGPGHSDQDNNYSIARDFVYKFFDIDDALDKISISNPKGLIQEMFHQNAWGHPSYRIIDEEGPDHERYFTVGLYLGEKLLATGSGNSKRKAEKAAAELHLKHLHEREQA
ncbi:ribonuclease III family protein [Methanolobus profundi]|uniref:Ribonuclease-3 n=1 Tax=Methanolobus profundi TaxID=487685 RepID=A0A1I4PR31_9EURY|nr:putative dsRNA-binding protein [Methanolobus profundi]SFM30164.1 ribonuclease-3 [Methanolobus profundi]